MLNAEHRNRKIIVIKGYHFCSPAQVRKETRGSGHHGEYRDGRVQRRRCVSIHVVAFALLTVILPSLMTQELPYTRGVPSRQGCMISTNSSVTLRPASPRISGGSQQRYSSSTKVNPLYFCMFGSCSQRASLTQSRWWMGTCSTLWPSSRTTYARRPTPGSPSEVFRYCYDPFNFRTLVF